MIVFVIAVLLLGLRSNMENANYDEGSGSGDSIVIEGTPIAQRRRKSRAKKRKRQEGVQSRIQSATEALDARVRDDSSGRSCSSPPVTPAKKKGRTKSSVIWEHCNNREVKGRIITYCNYCPKTSWELKSSTSTALSHVKQHHFDKLTHDERNDLMDKMKGTTSPSSKLPARSPKAVSAFFSGHKISHDSKKGRELNVKLLFAMISSSVSFNILDCPVWGVFVERHGLRGKYQQMTGSCSRLLGLVEDIRFYGSYLWSVRIKGVRHSRECCWRLLGGLEDKI